VEHKPINIETAAQTSKPDANRVKVISLLQRTDINEQDKIRKKIIIGAGRGRNTLFVVINV